jgi:hypothetical protein
MCIFKFERKKVIFLCYVVNAAYTEVNSSNVEVIDGKGVEW